MLLPFITKASPSSYLIIRYESFFASEPTSTDAVASLDTTVLRQNITSILTYLQQKNLDNFRIGCIMDLIKKEAASTGPRTVPLPKIVTSDARQQLLASQTYYCMTLPFVLKYNELFHYDLLPPAAGITCSK